jgi:hypothetical protein
MAAAYPCSTRSAVAQFTLPLATMITTGTPTPVRVFPQDVPAAPAEALVVGLGGEHPAKPVTAAAPTQARTVAAAQRRAAP